MAHTSRKAKKRIRERRLKEEKRRNKNNSGMRDSSLILSGTAVGSVFFENSINALVPALVAPSVPIAGCIIGISACAMTMYSKNCSKK